jgi:hypothetical protein
MPYRYKLARYIAEGDRLLICSIWYEVKTAVDRYVRSELAYRHLVLEVEGAVQNENTMLVMVYPVNALVKIKGAKKT